MRLAAVYFHAYPYTSNEAKEKVIALASIVGRYALPIRLTVIPFTKVQVRIKEKAPEAWTTVLMRMAMMDLSSRLARAIKAKCLITGESIGQVASQTIENMTCTESRASLPVLRPLVGTDKIDTIRVSKEIGTYDTSILPYADCCVLFSPKHPVLKADLAEATELYESLGLEPYLEEAFMGRVTEKR
jgi:thiamine biosynthesis protein ThiI